MPRLLHFAPRGCLNPHPHPQRSRDLQTGPPQLDAARHPAWGLSAPYVAEDDTPRCRLPGLRWRRAILRNARARVRPVVRGHRVTRESIPAIPAEIADLIGEVSVVGKLVE